MRLPSQPPQLLAHFPYPLSPKRSQLGFLSALCLWLWTSHLISLNVSTERDKNTFFFLSQLDCWEPAGTGCAKPLASASIAHTHVHYSFHLPAHTALCLPAPPQSLYIPSYLENLHCSCWSTKIPSLEPQGQIIPDLPPGGPYWKPGSVTCLFA